MRSVESEGNTIDEAIENALRLLRLDREAVEIEILENATKGILGFGNKKARVRARERAKLDEGLTSAAPENAPTAAEPEAPRSPAAVEVRGTERLVSRETPHGDEEDAAKTRAPARPRPERREGDGNGAAGLRDILDRILQQMGVDCSVEVGDDPTGEATLLCVSGRDGGIVIGRRGQTLDAIEHLLNRMALKASPTTPTRVRVDVEGYRERRQESLEQLARRLAAKAKETGRVVTLNPMSPRDRRVVHLTLQADDEVTTWSQGEGHFRRLLIGPRDERRQDRTRE